MGSTFRFSAKYTDGETGLIYYGYRYRNLVCWLSRDPLGEFVIVNTSHDDFDLLNDASESQEHINSNISNPYVFCKNNSSSLWDIFGLVPQGPEFFSQYPDYKKYQTPEEVWNIVGGSLQAYMKKQPGYPQNSCATRISYALNGINGEQIAKKDREFVNDVKRGHVGRAGNYIVNAIKMKAYLIAQWGTEAECSLTKAYSFVSKATTADDLRKEIADTLKKCKCNQDYYAVIVYESAAGSNYSGHVAVITKEYDDGETPLPGARSNRVWILPPTQNPPPPKK